MADAPHAYAVIMAGGSGTRFWPVSRRQHPKQLINLLGPESFIQQTVARLSPLIPPERTFVITTEVLAESTRSQLPALPSDHIIAEPVGRDTAPCVALAARIIEAIDPEGTMILLPADHVISPVDAFQRCLSEAITLAASGRLVTLGIRPNHAATGYGYIACGSKLACEGVTQACEVEAFVEKPDQITAEAYLAAGNYLWNSGMFIWQVKTVLHELQRHCPELMEQLGDIGTTWKTVDWKNRLAETYPTLTKISVDFALLEKTDQIAVIPAAFNWDDLGSWDALYGHLHADAKENRCQGDVVEIGCEDSLIYNASSTGTVAAVGLREMTVVMTDDGVLVCPKGHSQQVKAVVNRLTELGKHDKL